MRWGKYQLIASYTIHVGFTTKRYQQVTMPGKHQYLNNFIKNCCEIQFCGFTNSKSSPPVFLLRPTVGRASTICQFLMVGLLTNLTSHLIFMLYSMVFQKVYIFSDCFIREFSATCNNLTCMCPVSEACDDDE